ncbi:Gfo/Idh/MocA family oxidoreductase [Oscillospiraceae bacterium MB08-C2-2]|nr:Gfo/Idh/MocA family oxidoreductase [Oscillospiraceae bacterium MB08-C2-2]
MKKVKTGIVGCGKVADLHARAYSRLENSEFTAVCSRSLEKAQALADQYGVKAYTDIRQMVEESGLEAVSICTPHTVHRASAVEAASCGCHIIIEKPLASSLEDCDAILAAQKAAGVKGAMLVQRRRYRPCMRVNETIEAGKIGKPMLGIVNMLGWRDRAYYESDPWRGSWAGEGGGVLPTQVTHQLDLLLWYMKSDIQQVYGVWRNFNHPYIEVEDTAVATITFKSGAVASVVASNSQNPALYGKVHIFGDNGAGVGVQTDGGAMFIAGMSGITEAPYNDLWTVPGEEELREQMKKQDEDFFFVSDPIYFYHEEQLGDFLTAIRQDTQPMVTIEEGRKTVELFTAIYLSTESGMPVQFPVQP